MARFIYLDHAATTRVHGEVAEIMQGVLLETFGNPSSPHSFGLEAERLVRQSREVMARAIGSHADEVYFTSGGTEADNLAIRGTLAAKHRQGRHVVASAIEHAAILETLQHLEERGICEYTLVAPDHTGKVSPEAVVGALRDDTVLVTVMLVNNEVGSVQPISDLVGLVKRQDPTIYCHTDAVQALGKMPLRVDELGVDLLTMSGHKIEGPKGIGSLYCRQGVRLISQITGGGQENDLRSGTENVPGIVGFAKAVTLSMDNMGENIKRWRKLQAVLLKHLETIPAAQIHGDPLTNAPHIMSVGFRGVRGEVLVHALAQEGLYVSTGAACSSRKHIASHVLKAMGVPKEVADGSIRISLGADTTIEEVDLAGEIIGKTVAELRLFQRN